MMKCVKIIFLAIILAPAATGQTTRSVPSQYPTIQAAISSAVTGDTVAVAPGVYSESINFLGKGLVIQGTMGPTVTTIRGNQSARVVTVGGQVPNSAVLDGFTITNGGGGIIIRNSSPTIQNCIVEYNATAATLGGAGILVETHPLNLNAPVIQDCIIRNNYAAEGGGGLMVDIYDHNSPAGDCYPLILRCVFEGNVSMGGTTSSCGGDPNPCRSQGGGAILMRRRDLMGTISATITDCEFRNNVCLLSGGGIHFEGGGPHTVRSCRFLHNRANSTTGIGQGGAICFSKSFGNVEGCLIAQNIAGYRGGGIFVGNIATTGAPPLITVTSCTITGNFSPRTGGVLTEAGTGASMTTIENSIIWGNTAPDVRSQSSGAISLDFCNVGSFSVNSSSNTSSLEPRFVDPTSEDYHLSRMSPLVDAGDPFATPGSVVDLDGGTRIVGTRIDIGVDEVPAAPLPGSNEDLEFHSFILGGREDPNETILSLSAGDVLQIRLVSTNGVFVGSSPLIVGQAYSTGFPPMSPPGLPGIHLDGFGGITIVLRGYLGNISDGSQPSRGWGPLALPRPTGVERILIPNPRIRRDASSCQRAVRGHRST